MKVAVCGGAGYVGSALVAGLKECGHRVVVFDTLLHKQSVPVGSAVVKDIREIEPADLLGVEVVYNLAAIVSEWICKERPAEALAVNTLGASQLARAAEVAGVRRYILASTASVYDGVSRDASHPCSEDEATPGGVYGLSKRLAEVVLEKQLKDSKMQFVALRKGTVFGLKGTTRPRFDLAVQMMLRDAVLEKTVRVHAGGSPFWRPWLALENAVGAYLMAADIPAGTYNCAGQNLTVREVAERVAAEFPGVEVVTQEHADKRSYVIDSQKIAPYWHATRTIQDFVREFAQKPPVEAFMRDPRWYNS